MNTKKTLRFECDDIYVSRWKMHICAHAHNRTCDKMPRMTNRFRIWFLICKRNDAIRKMFNAKEERERWNDGDFNENSIFATTQTAFHYKILLVNDIRPTPINAIINGQLMQSWLFFDWRKKERANGEEMHNSRKQKSNYEMFGGVETVEPIKWMNERKKLPKWIN